MKKVLAVAILGVIVLSSCKKDYTCECKGDMINISIAMDKQKKKDAENSCDAAETTYKGGDASVNCTLN